MPGGLQPYRLTASCLKTQLLGADRKPYSSDLPGSLGGNGKMKVYGRLDCSSARRAVAAGDTTKSSGFSSLTKPPLLPLAIDRAETACATNIKSGVRPLETLRTIQNSQKGTKQC